MISNRKRLKASDYSLEERVVATNRVTKVVEGGRSFSASVVVVVGNGAGVVGYGLGKAKELTDAIAKGVEEAKRNLIQVPIFRDTIPHDAVGKYGGGKVLIKPAASGTGVIAGGGVRVVLESAGVKNVLSKSMGSSNPHNVVKATFKALLQLRDPLTIARQRGISLEQLFHG